MIRKKISLIMAALLLGSALAGCRQEEEVLYKTEVRAQNDGEAAALTIGLDGLDQDLPDYVKELDHIIEKYRADFPNTEITYDYTLRTEDGPVGLAAGGNAQAPDLVRVLYTDQNREQGLADLSEYQDFWECEGSLTAGTTFAMHHMGAGALFAVPADMEQNLLYFRRDWFNAFNEGKRYVEEQALVDTWGGLLQARDKLGDQGWLAVSRDQAAYCFDAILWSALGSGGLADRAAAFFSPGEEGATVFSTDKAKDVAMVFEKLYNVALDGGRMTKDEAVEAFIDGKAGMLIADASAARLLTEKMPADSFTARGMPQTDNGQTLVSCKWWGWGVNDLSAEREKAIHFLCYMTNADNNTHLSAVCGIMPMYKEALMMEPEMAQGDRRFEMALLGEAANRYASEPLMYGEDGLGGAALQARLEGFLDGEVSAEEMLVGLDDGWSEAYQRQGALWDWTEDEEQGK